jgi:hypothetical protein
MINRLFYSVFIEGQKSSSPFQIEVSKNQITSNLEESRGLIQIDEQSFVRISLLDNLFMKRLLFIDVFEIPEFLNYHRDEYQGGLGDFIRNLEYVFESNKVNHYLKSFDGDYIFGAVQDMNMRMSTTYIRLREVKNWINQINIEDKIKLKWAGTPAQFGYIFLELEKKGFIEIPKTGGIPSYKKFANICFDLFEIKTTIGNLEKEMNSKSNSLTSANRNDFKIPNKTDLSKS